MDGRTHLTGTVEGSDVEHKTVNGHDNFPKFNRTSALSSGQVTWNISRGSAKITNKILNFLHHTQVKTRNLQPLDFGFFPEVSKTRFGLKVIQALADYFVHLRLLVVDGPVKVRSQVLQLNAAPALGLLDNPVYEFLNLCFVQFCFARSSGWRTLTLQWGTLAASTMVITLAWTSASVANSRSGRVYCVIKEGKKNEIPWSLFLFSFLLRLSPLGGRTMAVVFFLIIFFIEESELQEELDKQCYVGVVCDYKV